MLKNSKKKILIINCKKKQISVVEHVMSIHMIHFSHHQQQHMSMQMYLLNIWMVIWHRTVELLCI